MSDKKLTDEEIIKALECCKYCCCKQCDEEPDFQEAIDLINYQKSEIEKLNIQLQELWKTASLYKANSEMWDNYNKNLLTANTALSNEVLSAKTEAYKDFAERLKTYCKEIIKQAWNQKVSPVSWSHAYADFIDDIENILKEMEIEERNNG